MSRTLYSTEDNGRFFHIPDASRLPEGAFVLRSLRGKTLRVHENSVANFEVPEPRAKEIAAVEMEEIARRARQMMTGAGSFLRGLAAGMANPPAPPPEREGRRQTIADALGVTPEQLTSDPQAVIAGLKQVGEGLQQAFKDSMEQEPDERTRERQAAVVSKLEELFGTGSVPPPDELPAKLEELLGNKELEESVRTAAADLKDAADRLRASMRPPGDDDER